MILKIPDPRLRLVSKAVREDDETIPTMVQTMLDAMIEAQGIGLAAIQIGIPLRVVVLGFEPHVLINPVITKMSTKKVWYQEGCLSVPDMFGEVRRPEKITVRFIGADGEEMELKADDVPARVIQHEIDHLDGVLFIDHLEPMGEA